MIRRKIARSCATALLALALICNGLAASAKPPLREVREIDDEMLWVAIAIEISDKCDRIDPRTLTGLGVLYALKSRAQKLGYTETEIRTYIKSPEEKARMRRRGERYARARGFDPSDPAAICDLGLSEIARSSKIGILLRAR